MTDLIIRCHTTGKEILLEDTRPRYYDGEYHLKVNPTWFPDETDLVMVTTPTEYYWHRGMLVGAELCWSRGDIRHW